MSRQYNNHVKKFKEMGYSVITPLEEFKETKKLTFSCDAGHQHTMSIASIINKLSKLNHDPSTIMCGQCQYTDVNDDLVKKYQSIVDKFEFTIIEVKKGGEIIYKCKCGEIRHTNRSNIQKTTGVCAKCMNDDNKYTLEEAKEIFKNGGCELLATEYHNNTTRMRYVCCCGSESEICLKQFMCGGRCKGCSYERGKSTCITKYGAENPFQVEEFKKKSRETCLEKYGVEYVMQNKEIRKMAEDTCELRYGKRWAFTLPEVYERIRATHKAKYGVEYPLQSKEVRDAMLEAFEEKFGTKYPMHCPELFKKAMRHRTKEYKTPDGRILLVSGYEDKCLDQLYAEGAKGIHAGIEDDKIPVIPYKFRGENSIYYPDIWVEERNRLIEVKALWFYSQHIEKCVAKAVASSKDYLYEFWLYDKSAVLKEIVRIYKGLVIYTMDSDFTFGLSPY